MTNATPERVSILNEAADLIVGQRQQDYGTPEKNFQRIADLVNIIIEENLRTNTPLSPRQCADIMILLKVARTVNTPTRDSYVDIGGYAGIAGELAQKEREAKDTIQSGKLPADGIKINIYTPDTTAAGLSDALIRQRNAAGKIGEAVKRGEA